MTEDQKHTLRHAVVVAVVAVIAVLQNLHILDAGCKVLAG